MKSKFNSMVVKVLVPMLLCFFSSGFTKTVEKRDSASKNDAIISLVISIDKGGCMWKTKLNFAVNGKNMNLGGQRSYLVPRYSGILTVPVTEYFVNGSNELRVWVHDDRKIQEDSTVTFSGRISLQATPKGGYVDTRSNKNEIWSLDLQVKPDDTIDTLMSRCIITLPLPAKVTCDSIVRPGSEDTVVSFIAPEVDEKYFLHYRPAILAHNWDQLSKADFTKLRFSYAALEHVAKSDTGSKRRLGAIGKELDEAQKKKDHHRCAELLDSLITFEPLNLEYHMSRWDHLTALKSKDTFNISLADALYASIENSGLGISKKNPFRTVVKGEISGFLWANNYESIATDLETTDSASYTIISVVDSTRDTIRLYFQDMTNALRIPRSAPDQKR